MKKLAFSLLCLGSIGVLSRFALPPVVGADPLAAITASFHHDLDNFQRAIDNYVAVFHAYKAKQSSIERLREAHLAARLTFKSVEYLLEYIDPGTVKKVLNGAPLPTLEPAIPEVVVLDPHGLQVLDERVFEAEETLDVLAIEAELRQLSAQLPLIIKFQKSQHLHHRLVFEACKLELIRIATLGLTGFDTPGSLAALPEAAAALNSLHAALGHYQALTNNTQTAQLETIRQLLEGVQARLLAQGQTFENFDRAAFFRQYFNPLQALLSELQTSLGIESRREIAGPPSASLLDGSPLFSESFFYLPYFQNLPQDEQLLQAQSSLGRLLFYDPVLSTNLQRSCASCHKPEKAFTDGQKTSLSIDGHSHILRNAPTLLNSVFAARFFYDLRENELSRQVRHVITDTQEFASDYLSIIERLGKSAEYRERFAQAYPEAGISVYSISHALAAYTAGLTSFDSPFDQYIRGESDEIAPEARRGFELFMGKAACGTCHFAPTFSGLVPPLYIENESEVLGVPMHPDSSRIDPDEGRMRSGRPQDEASIYQYSFKTPTVRNIALTAPYMHNGAYPDLASVIDFYNKGGGAGLSIQLSHQTLPTDPLDLSKQEISDLIHFMEALTDTKKVGTAPQVLPIFEGYPAWNDRVPGGVY